MWAWVTGLELFSERSALLSRNQRRKKQTEGEGCGKSVGL